MTSEEHKALASDIAQGIATAHKEESPINPQNIFYALGVAAVLYVGYSFNQSVEGNAEKLDTLTEAVSKLVLVSETQQTELAKRGDWMEGIDTYSVQSRIKDNEHDRKYEELDARLGILEGKIR